MAGSLERHVAFERAPILDHCGIVAIHAPRAEVQLFADGLAALRDLQTRGHDGAGAGGMRYCGETFVHKGKGMLDDAFPESVQGKLRQRAAQTWVFQVRYGTNGAFCPENVQPFIGVHQETGERFIVAHNGQFSDDGGNGDNGMSDTHRFTEELARSKGHTWQTRISTLLLQKSGAWSLAIATGDGLFLARDPYGFRPLLYGRLWHPDTRQHVWVAASETRALERLGIREFTEVMHGQLLQITDTVSIVSDTSVPRHPTPCIFETVYLHDGASLAHLPRRHADEINRAPTVDALRRRCGRILAREAPLTRDDVDFVVGIPGTGIVGGMAYAEALELPYRQVMTDRIPQGNPRTFLTADIASIDALALRHFSFDASAIEGMRIGTVDDSVVRGKIQGAVNVLLRQYGAQAVHCRSLSPPIDKGCFLGVNTRTNDELIAFRHGSDVRAIARAVHADSLAYLSSEGLREALTGSPRSKRFCMGCMVGHRPPIDPYGSIYERE